MRGLSPLQQSILDVLPSRNEQPIPPRDVMDALGLDRSKPAVRVAVSKSLKRLAARGFVLVWRPEVCWPGKGYLYSRD